MFKEHLKKVVEKLVIFEKEPKEIEGRKITDWFRLAEDIFTEFYKLGVSLQWDYSIIKKQADVTDVISEVTRNQEWLQTFINIYPNLRIDLDLVGCADKVCEVRSGIEVLFRGFKGLDGSFDKVLEELEELGEVDELDRCLENWVNTGHRPDFASNEKPSNAPTAHWWWH